MARLLQNLDCFYLLLGLGLPLPLPALAGSNICSGLLAVALVLAGTRAFAGHAAWP